ncbi:MAG: hypothetical protein MUC49_17570 [Raineya sp.]|jgi:hypothetical protein|nr:hypothetical protein [Raineya sp.]
MKKGLFVLAIASMSLMMGSCKSSKKGAWTDGDKKTFTKLCEESFAKEKGSANMKTIESVGVKIEEFTKKSCDCLLSKAEQQYDNVKAADKDASGITKIAGDCGGQVIQELMKK